MNVEQVDFIGMEKLDFIINNYLINIVNYLKIEEMQSWVLYKFCIFAFSRDPTIFSISFDPKGREKGEIQHFLYSNLFYLEKRILILS